MIKIGGIYKITNLANGKIYIGSATYIRQRIGMHKYLLRNNNHDNSYLQNAWNKFGEECFTFEEIEIVQDLSKLIEIEQKWINDTRCFDRNIGYNLRLEANNNFGISYNIGNKHSKETIEKIRNSNKGKKRTDETKLKIAAWQKGIIPIKAMEAARLVNKKLEKWPCELGHKCRCLNCKNTRNEYLRSWRANKAIAGRAE